MNTRAEILMDTVVSQIQRYMGYALDDLAEHSQIVRGATIALEDDLKIRQALQMTRNKPPAF